MKYIYSILTAFLLGCNSQSKNVNHHDCDEYFYRKFIHSTELFGNSFDRKSCNGSNELYLFMLNPDQTGAVPKRVIKYVDMYRKRGIDGISNLNSNEIYAIYLYYNFTYKGENSISGKETRKILNLSIDKNKQNPLPYISKLYEKFILDDYIAWGTEVEFVDSLLILYPNSINLYELRKELTLFDGRCVPESDEQKFRIAEQLSLLKNRGYYNKELFGDSLMTLSNQIDSTLDKIDFDQFMDYVYEFNYKSRFEKKRN